MNVIAENTSKIRVFHSIRVKRIVPFTSVCANFAVSIFWAFAKTLSLGTANCWAAFSFSFASFSSAIKRRKQAFSPSLKEIKANYFVKLIVYASCEASGAMVHLLWRITNNLHKSLSITQLKMTFNQNYLRAPFMELVTHAPSVWEISKITSCSFPNEFVQMTHKQFQ